MIVKAKRHPKTFCISLLLAIICFFPFIQSSINDGFSQQLKKDEQKINLKYETRPKTVHPGETGTLIVTIETIKGIKLTNYPQTSIMLSGDEEIIFEENLAKLGDGKLPEDLTANFLKKVDPIEFKFKVNEKTSKDAVIVKADISYFYCETKSGYCSRGKKQADLTIPIKKKS